MSRRLVAGRPRRPSPPAPDLHAGIMARSRYRRYLPVYGLLLPGMLLYGLWVAFPLIQSFLMSFTDWRLRGQSHFLGLDNYTRALNDPFFWRALTTTIGYTAVTVAGQLLLGLAAALLLQQSFRGRGVLRLVYYLPVITSWVMCRWCSCGCTTASPGS